MRKKHGIKKNSIRTKNKLKCLKVGFSLHFLTFHVSLMFTNAYEPVAEQLVVFNPPTKNFLSTAELIRQLKLSEKVF